MGISLYTSRIVLEALGVDDYGIYSVVGGLVTMFSIITSSLVTAINRYLSYELGRNNLDRLEKIFTTSINIQILLCLVVLILGETIGVWFLNNYMSFPSGSLYSANWVFQSSIVVFILNLINIPYNSVIIAHERMKAFAYFSIFESVLKLIEVLILFFVKWDNKLILYSLLQVVVSFIMRCSYGIYCTHNFKECKYKFYFEKNLTKEMFGFAGWNLFSNASFVLNTQGVNILINIFFGVAVNAARGIAVQVDTAIMNFVNSFTTAINPQIIKAYSSGAQSYLWKLIIDGSRYTYYLTLVFVIPILLDTNYILHLWLKQVPDYTIIFIQLSFIYSVFNSIGTTAYFACVAHGNMKYYTLHLTTVSCLVFPFTWIAYKMGAPVEICYVINGMIAFFCIFIRLRILNQLISFDSNLFIREMLLPSLIIFVITIFPPLIIKYFLESSFLRLIIIVAVSEISLGLSIFIIGLNKNEKDSIKKFVTDRIHNMKFIC